MQQDAIRFRHLIRLSQVNATRFILQALKTAGADHRLKFTMQLLLIRAWTVVEDHQINFQAFEVEILMTPHDLSHGFEIITLFNSHDYDRQVTADSVCPKT